MFQRMIDCALIWIYLDFNRKDIETFVILGTISSPKYPLHETRLSSLVCLAQTPRCVTAKFHSKIEKTMIPPQIVRAKNGEG